MNDRFPLVSVVIPTRNEARFIDRCLRSIFAADAVAGGLEVLVVDGMSTDRTRQILARWRQKQPNLRVLDNPLGIVPSAMNIGIRAARGKWIIRADAHSEYPANYFTLCMDRSRQTDADNVGGGVTTLIQNEGWQGTLVRALTTHWFGVGNSVFRTTASARWIDTVPFGCYRRDVFTRIGLYDERLVRNQDYELNRRLTKMGGRVWYDPCIQILYYNQSSLRGLFRQAFTTGQWNPWMWFTAPYSFAWRHAVPMAFVGALFFASLLFWMNPTVSSITFTVIVLPYLLLALSASYQQASRYGAGIFLALPFLFFTYHLVYGLGGLWGLCLLLIRRSPVQMTSQAQYDAPGPTPVKT